MANINWAALQKIRWMRGMSFNASISNVTKCQYSYVTLSPTINGGTLPFTYLWSPATGLSSVTASAPTASSTATQTYTLTITDANQLQAITNVSVGIYPALSVSETWMDVSCFGGSDGEAIINITAGSSPYTYNWSNGIGLSNSSISGLTARSISAIVTDGCGATALSQFTISEPSILGVTMSSTNIICNGGVGSATASPYGGTSPYTYLWSTTSTASHIQPAAGTYSVTITDHNGCQITGTVSLTQPATYSMVVGVTATASVSNINDLVGMSASVYTGTSPYTYIWHPGNMTGGTATYSLTQSTTFTVVVTDHCGITGSATASILLSNADPNNTLLLHFDNIT